MIPPALFDRKSARSVAAPAPPRIALQQVAEREPVGQPPHLGLVQRPLQLSPARASAARSSSVRDTEVTGIPSTTSTSSADSRRTMDHEPAVARRTRLGRVTSGAIADRRHDAPELPGRAMAEHRVRARRPAPPPSTAPLTSSRDARRRRRHDEPAQQASLATRPRSPRARSRARAAAAAPRPRAAAPQARAPTDPTSDRTQVCICHAMRAQCTPRRPSPPMAGGVGTRGWRAGVPIACRRQRKRGSSPPVPPLALIP